MKNKYSILCIICLSICLFLFAEDKDKTESDAKKEKTEYQKYIELDKFKKIRMVKEYVRKDKFFWTAQRGTYRVYSSVSPELTLRYTLLMQDFSARIRPFFKVTPKSTFKPVVYVTKTKKSMIGLAKRHLTEHDYTVGNVGTWPHGLYSPSLKRLYVYDGKYTIQCMFHEGTHQYLHYLIGKNYEFVPRWIDEGLAANFETWDPKDTIEVNLKKSRERSTRKYVLAEIFRYKKLPISLKELVMVSKESWDKAKGKMVDYQYAAAWSFTDFLLNSEKGREFINLVLGAAQEDLSIPAEAIVPYADKWETYVKEEVLPLIKQSKKK